MITRVIRAVVVGLVLVGVTPSVIDLLAIFGPLLP